MINMKWSSNMANAPTGEYVDLYIPGHGRLTDCIKHSDLKGWCCKQNGRIDLIGEVVGCLVGDPTHWMKIINPEDFGDRIFTTWSPE